MVVHDPRGLSFDGDVYYNVITSIYLGDCLPEIGPCRDMVPSGDIHFMFNTKINC